MIMVSWFSTNSAATDPLAGAPSLRSTDDADGDGGFTGAGAVLPMGALWDADVDDAIDLLERPDDVLEMAQVAAQEAKCVGGAPIGPRAAGRLADVDAFGVEGFAHGGKNARTVGRRDAEFDGTIDLRFGVPRHVHLALRIGFEGLLAIATVNGDPATAGEKAHDLVARQRVAALGVADQDIVHAVEEDAV